VRAPGTDAGRRAPSIARRLLGRLVVVFALAFVGSCSLYLMLAWLKPTVEIHGEIAALTDELAASVKPGADGQPAFDPSPALSAKLRDRHIGYVAIELASGHVLATSAQSIVELLPVPPAGGPPRLAFAEPEPGQHLTVARIGFMVDRELPAGKIRVAVIRHEHHAWPFLSWAAGELVEEVLPIGIPLFFATLIVSAATIRRTLRPVAQLSRQAEAITPQTTGLRLDDRGQPQEIRPLVHAFNAALERLDQGFMIQRRFTANAAHQLRTPLAILRARLDSLPPGPAMAALKQDCDRTAHAIAQILSIARLEAHQIEITETVDLCRLAAGVVAEMAPLAIDRGRTLALEAPVVPVMTRANSAALQEALRNLIENALRFGPRGSTIDVAVGPDASLAVGDRGPGVSEEDRRHVFEPFWRGRSPQEPGSGLGLAIVAEVVAAHGGRTQVLARPGGGAEFRIELPPVALPLPQPASPAMAAQ